MQRAYHVLHLPDGSIKTMAVVVFDAEGRPLSWHPFTQEEPYTEWCGGEYILKNT